MDKKDFRTPEEVEKDKEKYKEDYKEEPYQMFVGRAQSKTERRIEMRDKFGVPDRGPAAPKSQGVNLYVKNLDENTDDDRLKQRYTPSGGMGGPGMMGGKDFGGKGFGGKG